ncbi:MAG: NifB/NifX family molybdenum-iron cluster-binding protein [Bacteroidales bacterium]
MKIAVPVTKSNQIDDHFGHCEYYNIYTISDSKEIVEVVTLKSEQGCGCKSNIASKLAALNVDTMLAGGIGSGAITVLNKAGITVIRGCAGDVVENVKKYLTGSIMDSGESCLQHEHHHSHNHSHNCNHNH